MKVIGRSLSAVVAKTSELLVVILGREAVLRLGGEADEIAWLLALFTRLGGRSGMATSVLGLDSFTHLEDFV